MFRSSSLACVAAVMLLCAPRLEAQNPRLAADTEPARQATASAIRCVTCSPRPKLSAAIGETFAFEMMPYSVNRWIGRKAEDQTTLQSWSYNLRRGWGWDNDHFPVNQFAHPYSGALFYNSGRSHGYDFWKSAPFALGGSVLWEYFGETTRPSVNDLANTTLGGISLGETMYRLSSLILDGRSTGAGRIVREAGAALVDPPRGLSRILSGDIARVGANPDDRWPSTVTSHLELGIQHMAAEVDSRIRRGPTRPFMDYSLAYGNPFAGDVRAPFGALRIQATVAGGVNASITEMRALGYLGVHDLRESSGSSQLLAAAMHYHYYNNGAFVTGGQGFSGGLLSRYSVPAHNSIHTEVWLTGIALGAVKSDFRAGAPASDTAGRSYDYGPGVGARFLARFDHGSHQIADLSYEPFWYDVLSGVARTHFHDVESARLQVPVYDGTSIGLRQLVYRRVARYATLPTTRLADGQTQLFLAITF